MRVDPDAGESKLGHVRFADGDRARLTQPPDDRRVAACWIRAHQHSRASPRRFAHDIEQILDTDDHPVERAEGASLTTASVGGVGGFSSAIPIDGEKCSPSFTRGIINAIEGALDTVTR